MGPDMALDKQRGLVGIDAGGEQNRRQIANPGAQAVRVLGDRDGVEVDDGNVAGARLLESHPLLNGAQVVAQVEAAGGLDAREDHRPGCAGRVHERQG